MKNSADQGECYPQRPKAEVDNRSFAISGGVSPFRSLFFSLFFCSPKITQSRPHVFSVNGSIICSGLHCWRHFDVIGSIIFCGLHFWRHWFNMTKILSKFGERQLVMVNYACGVNQSETGKYFEWIINHFIFSCLNVQRERSSPSRNATQLVPKIKPGLTVRVAFITVFISQAVLHIHLHLPHLRVY